MEFFMCCAAGFFPQLIGDESPPLFIPTRYELYPDLMCLKDQVMLSTLYFISDEQELAAFSWSAKPINDLLRRSINVERRIMVVGRFPCCICRKCGRCWRAAK